MKLDNRVLAGAVFVVLCVVVFFVFFGSQKEIFFVDGVKEVDGFWLDAGFSRDVLSDLSQSQASLEKLD
ncbi:hypothetical protein KKG83_04280, partial [Candidatus Micrarchaeota archaeon]|nr:hypothetical protein [Candidatus Micrarchaeota archaeon]MBU2476662.1 hypothetical protein [Candidatus Micrarchaeota archaeon]